MALKLMLTRVWVGGVVAGQGIGYVRVSTLDQNEKGQLDGQVLDRVFTDKASGRDTASRGWLNCCVSPATGTSWWCTAWTGPPATWTTCGALVGA